MKFVGLSNYGAVLTSSYWWHALSVTLVITVISVSIGLVLGMPDWVFWSVVLPWGLSLVFSFWFCFFYMSDDDLGRDPEENDHA